MQPARTVNTEPTPFQRDLICRAIKAGCATHEAAQRAGVESTTFYEWMRRGERELEGACRDFFDAVQKAELAATQLLH